MLAKKYKDIRARQVFLHQESSRKINKFLFTYFLSKKNKLPFLALKFKQKAKSSKTKLLNRCVFTNRNRGVIKAYSISRVYLRELMQFGIVAGIKKAVW